MPRKQRNCQHQSQAGNQQRQTWARRRRTSLALGAFPNAEPAAAVLLLLQLLGAVLAVPWQGWRYLQDDGGGTGGGGGGGGGTGSRQPVEEQVAGVYTPLDSANTDSDTGGTAQHAPHRVA